MKDSKKVCAYYRVSTKDKQTLDSQRFSVEKYCESRGFTIVKTYSDKLSGNDPNRPGLLALLNDSAKPRRPWNAVVIYSLDRLSRGGIYETIKATLVFRDTGVGLISVSEPYIDTSTPMGRLYFSIASCMAELELERISARVVGGMDRARAEGKIFGRPQKPVPAEEISLMVRLRKLGLSWNRIRIETGETWTIGTIRNRVNLALREELASEKLRMVPRKGQNAKAEKLLREPGRLQGGDGEPDSPHGGDEAS